jgi:dihydropteroate synthase
MKGEVAPFLKLRPDGRPRLMGIINTTPDSFHSPSRQSGVASATELALQMWKSGADWVDVGGESTRPGADSVDEEVEAARVVPVIGSIAAARRDVFASGGKMESAMLISVDTRRPSVARAALAAGADMVNDVSGLRDSAMVDLVLEAGCAVCIMHMQGEPSSMQDNPEYSDIVAEVSEKLLTSAENLVHRGMDAGLICIDPGIGFGKTLIHNLKLLQNPSDLRGGNGISVLWGASRKSMFKELLGRQDSDDRLAGTLAVAAYGMAQGVDILRVHDVEPHDDLLKTLGSLDGVE